MDGHGDHRDTYGIGDQLNDEVDTRKRRGRQTGRDVFDYLHIVVVVNIEHVGNGCAHQQLKLSVLQRGGLPNRQQLKWNGDTNIKLLFEHRIDKIFSYEEEDHCDGR